VCGPWRDPTLATEIVDVGTLPCRPCAQRTCEPGDFRCLRTISPETVMAAARRAMERERIRNRSNMIV
jgi:ADP-heptose:LPS heptosyltransferase